MKIQPNFKMIRGDFKYWWYSIHNVIMKWRDNYTTKKYSDSLFIFIHVLILKQVGRQIENDYRN